MQNTARKAIRSLFCLCSAALLLCGCGGNARGSRGYSTTLELAGTVSDSTLEVRYPSGETAAALPLDTAATGFPGTESAAAEQDGEEAALTVFYGSDFAGLQWAVVCSGPSAGLANSNVLLSTDGGKTWNLISSAENTTHEVVTGAGFKDREHGFLCCRYTQDSGPVIYATADGGASWERLDTAVPPAYAAWKKTPGSPVITGQSVCFPITLRDEKGTEFLAWCSSQDLKTWVWSGLD